MDSLLEKKEHIEQEIAHLDATLEQTIQQLEKEKTKLDETQKTSFENFLEIITIKLINFEQK